MGGRDSAHFCARGGFINDGKRLTSHAIALGRMGAGIALDEEQRFIGGKNRGMQ